MPPVFPPDAAGINPYAPPVSELRHDTGEGCWRDGKLIVLRQGHDLPQRCLRCNAPGQPWPKPRRYYWHTPWLFLLVLFNFLIYAVVALLVRKSVALHPVLCDAHRRDRQRSWMTFWMLLLAGVSLWVLAPSVARLGYYGRVGMGVLGALLFLGGLLMLSRKLGLLVAAGIDKDYVRLKGASLPFLDSLPPFDGVPPPPAPH